MHESSLLRMQWFVGTYLNDIKPTSVLDVGSFDVNGSYKQFFSAPHFSYTGLDMSAGPNVDIVPAHAYNWIEIKDNTYDVVISGQALEHIEFFWVTMAEMTRVLQPGGLMCIVAPRGFIRHRYPVDCYRFDADGMVALARFCNLVPLHASTNSAPVGASSKWYSDVDADSLLVAQKPLGWTRLVDPSTYVFSEPDMDLLCTGFEKKKCHE